MTSIPLVAARCQAGHVTMTAAHVDSHGDPADPGRCLVRLDHGCCRSQLAVMVCSECGGTWDRPDHDACGWIDSPVHDGCCRECTLTDEGCEP